MLHCCTVALLHCCIVALCVAPDTESRRDIIHDKHSDGDFYALGATTATETAFAVRGDGSIYSRTAAAVTPTTAYVRSQVSAGSATAPDAGDVIREFAFKA